MSTVDIASVVRTTTGTWASYNVECEVKEEVHLAKVKLSQRSFHFDVTAALRGKMTLRDTAKGNDIWSIDPHGNWNRDVPFVPAIAARLSARRKVVGHGRRSDQCKGRFAEWRGKNLGCRDWQGIEAYSPALEFSPPSSESIP